MMQTDRAVILAAGLGTRLKWVTDSQPKALAPLAGEPAIGYVIRRLVTQGIREIAVNAHHHADQLADFLGDGAKFGCHIAISHETELLDSGGGVKQALSLLPGTGPVLVHNADVIADIDIHRLCEQLPAEGGVIALVENPAHHLNGDFSLDHGQVSMGGYDRFTFAGVSLWNAAVFDRYEAGEDFSLARTIREEIAREGCHGVVHRGDWFDIGRPVDLMRASRKLGA